MWRQRFKSFVTLLVIMLKYPRICMCVLSSLHATVRGYLYSSRWTHLDSKGVDLKQHDDTLAAQQLNPLRVYFDVHRQGRGIWKWLHYFDIYHHYLKKFREREVHVLEIGIYSGGSLAMWRDYFGEYCNVYGVDIEETTKIYEDDRTQVMIGDQADRQFWKEVKRKFPIIDIVIDDGGHLLQQQVITLEEVLPHIRPGGIYICEDVHGNLNQFIGYIYGLMMNLNTASHDLELHVRGKLNAIKPTQFQKDIYAIHVYPFAVVIEKTYIEPEVFLAPKHGTEWQPFL